MILKIFLTILMVACAFVQSRFVYDIWFGRLAPKQKVFSYYVAYQGYYENGNLSTGNTRIERLGRVETNDQMDDLKGQLLDWLKKEYPGMKAITLFWVKELKNGE